MQMKHYAKTGKAGKAGHTLFDSIYVQCPQRAKPQRKEVSTCQGLGQGSKGMAADRNGVSWASRDDSCRIEYTHSQVYG